MPPKRPQQHATDVKACAIVKKALADWASVNPHPEDYGIDFTAEPFDVVLKGPRSGSGEDFQIQVKGSQCLRQLKHEAAVSFLLGAQDLLHYVENKRLPVFLIVVDVLREVGFFICLQEWAARQSKATWRRKATVTVRIPTANALSDEHAFRTAVAHAHRRMCELKPGSITGAIAAAKRRVQSIDPRFDCQVSADECGTHITLIAKQPVSAQFRFQGQADQLDKLMHDLIGRGKPVSPKERGIKLEVVGLPVLASDLDALRSLQFERRYSGALRVVLLRHGQIVNCFELNGEWRGGIEEMTLRAQLPSSVFGVEVALRRVGNVMDKPRVTVEFDYTDWIGKSIRFGLRDFDRLNSVIGQYEDGDHVDIEVSVEGNTVATCTLPQSRHEWLQSVASVLTLFRELRGVLNGLCMDLQLTRSLNELDASEIESAAAFMAGGEIELKMTSGSFTTSGGGGEQAVGKDLKGSIRCRREVVFQIQDQGIRAGCAEIVCEHAMLRLLKDGTKRGVRERHWEFRPVGRCFMRRVELEGGH